MPKKAAGLCLLLFIFISLTPARIGLSQKMSTMDKERATEMMDDVAREVEKHYYNPDLLGAKWDAKVKEEKERIKEETSLNMSLSHIAATLDSLNDSHTFFLPPPRPYRHDYGWQMQMIGEKCFVTRVRPGSDADSKGVKPGDEVELLNGFRPDRDNLWKMDYVNKILRPQPGLRLVLRDPEGRERTIDAMAKFIQTKKVTNLTLENGDTDIWNLVREIENEERMNRVRYIEEGDDLIIVKIPQFFFDMDEVDTLMGKARKHKGMIIDLRGNPGGAVDSLRFLISKVFDHDVKIADRVGRKKYKPEIAKSKGNNSFEGKLVVLVDSKSGSAAELFARVVQLEKRATIIGDRSSGSVMEARHYDYHTGIDTVVFYGASITESDLIMSDGKSLEHVGVSPDEEVIPTAADLAAGRDPVLAHAAESLGVKLSPQEAGKMFPYEWPPE